MGRIVELKGEFVEYHEERVRLENGREIVHRFERPTELWWKLKEAVKGRKVRILVEDLGEEE
ncbi:MAG: hypothetical protein GXO14_00455 [Thermococci archaeon]|nr:hypothetical protein [Thermococci archaeon]